MSSRSVSVLAKALVATAREIPDAEDQLAREAYARVQRARSEISRDQQRRLCRPRYAPRARAAPWSPGPRSASSSSLAEPRREADQLGRQLALERLLYGCGPLGRRHQVLRRPVADRHQAGCWPQTRDPDHRPPPTPQSPDGREEAPRTPPARGPPAL